MSQLLMSGLNTAGGVYRDLSLRCQQRSAFAESNLRLTPKVSTKPLMVRAEFVALLFIFSLKFWKHDLLHEAISGQGYKGSADCKPSPEVGASLPGCVDCWSDIRRP